MSEEEAKSVNNQEAAVPEAESERQEPNQAPNETTETSQERENSKEFNFARLRKKNEELERQIYELRENLTRKVEPTPEPDEIDTLGDDDILTKKQAAKLAEKRAQELINKTLAEREKASLPDKTRTQFQDYDQVMTIDNVKKFEQEEPGLAAACAGAPNPWEATYKMLKKFVLTPEEVKSTKLEEKMKDNLSKPQSSNSVARQGPLANANMWAEASKEQLYKEMIDAANRG